MSQSQESTEKFTQMDNPFCSPTTGTHAPQEGKRVRKSLVSCKAYIIIQNRPVTRNEGTRMRQQFQTKAIRGHLMERYHWTNLQWDAIDWEGFRSALHSLPQHKQWKLTKFWFGWLDKWSEEETSIPIYVLLVANTRKLVNM